jgi:hypothetical protein
VVRDKGAGAKGYSASNKAGVGMGDANYAGNISCTGRIRARRTTVVRSRSEANVACLACPKGKGNRG